MAVTVDPTRVGAARRAGGGGLLAARGASRRAYAGTGDAVLVAGVRAGDAEAWDELFLRFEPVLLRDARRLGVPTSVRDDLVCETVAAAVERLEAGGPAPGSLGGYLRQAFRNRYLNHERAERRRERATARATEAVADCAGVLTASFSAYTLRLVREPTASYTATDASTPSDALRVLAQTLAATLRPGERELLERAHGGATRRELAAWLGVTPAAAAKRLQRLRHRLIAAAHAHAEAAPAPDRRAVLRLIERAGVPAVP